MTTATETQRTFATLYREKLELQDRLNAVTKELEGLQEPMLNYFADAGMSSAKVDGLTIYINTQLWANTKDGSTPEQACEALVAGGFGEFVAPRFNTQSLSARAREMAKNGEEWPASVLEHIKVAEKVEIRGRRS